MSVIQLKPLKGKKKFDELFEKGKRVKRNGCLALVKFHNWNTSEEACSLEQNNSDNDRIVFFAVSVSKKTAKKAVIRNRIKRLLRESLRMILKENGNLFDLIDTIEFIWRWAPGHPKLIRLNDVKPVVETILRNIRK